MRKIVKFYLCLLSLLNIFFSYGQTFKEGLWAGSIYENGTVYSYTLEIKSVIGNEVSGLSISKNSNFSCTATFDGVVSNNQLTISEKKVISTNYPNKDDICLMKINLQLKNELLIGEFTSNNKLKRKCGKGVVSLKLKSTGDLKSNTNSEKVANKLYLSIDEANTKDSLLKSKTNFLESSPKVLSFKDIRKVDISNVVYVSNDSVHIEVYDNGVIDGDEVTLFINGIEIINGKKLSDKPIEFDLKKQTNKEFIIEFYANNLGTIPPNTGLIIIKNNMFRKELIFSSDFSKTNAIKIVFN